MTFRPVTERDGSAGENAPLRVAQYVRMSTDHQRYSTENQEAAIAIYAMRHGMTIVQTYADEAEVVSTFQDGTPSSNSSPTLKPDRPASRPCLFTT